MLRPSEDRSELWLPLLRQLTEEVPSWYVWKNAASALAGPGDVDSAAPEAAWDRIRTIFREWAADGRADHVMECRHIPRTLNLVAVSPRYPDLLQLEVKGLTTLRGSTLFSADALLPLTTLDPRGFRKLRPGAEGLFKFITNGVRRGGEPDEEGLRSKNVLELLDEDPEGARLAARVFGWAEPHILAAVERARSGEWDRAALRRVERRALLRNAREPRVAWERIWFRIARKPFCPLLRVVYAPGREIPIDRTGWLARVARSHRVHGRVHGVVAREAHP